MQKKKKRKKSLNGRNFIFYIFWRGIKQARNGVKISINTISIINIVQD